VVSEDPVEEEEEEALELVVPQVAAVEVL